MTTNPINTLAVRALAARHHRSECDSNSNTGSRSCDHTYDRTVLEPGCSFINEDPFYIVDLGVVASQLERWRAALPRVIPYYAVKCNPDPVIVQTLALLGCSFDCASRGEISLVQNVSAELPDDVPKPDIIFANPCKGRAHIIDAVCRGVQYMTFDNVAEIHKCASVSKRIKLVLRIFADDSGSQIQLSTKFGAPRQHWNKLLVEAKQAGLEVVGVSFHVGCGCRDVTRYEMALRDAKEVFEMARRDFGFEMRILDIGGGFPGETLNSVTHEYDKIDDNNPKSEAKEEESTIMYFEKIAVSLALMLDEIFPPSSGVKIIAEPGRYFVAACATLVASVISVRVNLTDDKTSEDEIITKYRTESCGGSKNSELQDNFAYYINDGVYGSFRDNILFYQPTTRPHKLCHKIVGVVNREGQDAWRTLKALDDISNGQNESNAMYPSTVFGPTCDSVDVLFRGVLLPKMHVGDWMYFQNMGAYTSAFASTFSGFLSTEKFYVWNLPSCNYKKFMDERRVLVDETKTLSHIHLELENQLPTTRGRSVALDFARQHAMVCLNMMS